MSTLPLSRRRSYRSREPPNFHPLARFREEAGSVLDFGSEVFGYGLADVGGGGAGAEVDSVACLLAECE